MSVGKDISADEVRLAEASEWFARLREENLPPEAIAAWLEWCAADPENLRAYRGVQEIYALAGDAGVVNWPQPHEVQADRYDGELSVAQWMKSSSSSRRSSWSRWAYTGAAAATLLLAVVVWYGASSWYSNEYVTARGVQRDVHLSDGSDLSLGGASAVRVRFNDRQRAVQLENGEAYFKVAHDPSRPFVVRTRALEITALGTAFTVRSDDAHTVIAVTEGRIEIAPLAGTDMPAHATSALRASAGQQVSYDAHTGKPTVRPSNTASALGWQDGALTYVDEPLSAVLARINRYSSRNVRLADPALGELRFTGTVFETHMEEWASGLERVFPVRVVRGAAGALTIESRD